MKVLLMHKDKDFDLKQKLPQYREILIQDLELNTLFNAMSHDDQFLYEVAKSCILSGFSNDLNTILFRQDILKDCLKNPSVIRDIYKIPIESIENKQKRWMRIFSSHPSSILGSAIDLLQMFVGLLKRLRRIADEHSDKFESEGFNTFFAMIRKELNEEYFLSVQNHLKALKFPNGVLMSAELGRGNEGTSYVLRKPTDRQKGWVRRIFTRNSPVYSFSIDNRDDQGARALSELKARGINLVANALAQSANHIDSFFEMLRVELAFYIGCINLYEALARIGTPLAFPMPVTNGAHKHSFKGLYDVCLTLTMQKSIVGNDVNADNKTLVMITGANQGGKSTFLRSIGLSQIMMQCGMFVPAESFCSHLCDGLFTHFKREEDATMKSGKLDEELGRMNGIIENITSRPILLFNESFAATNEREGSEIARQIINALLERNFNIFFVTHLYELARGFYERKNKAFMFLRAERQENGSRTFRIIEEEPLETGYGMDLYQAIWCSDDEKAYQQ